MSSAPALEVNWSDSVVVVVEVTAPVLGDLSAEAFGISLPESVIGLLAAG
jgi:hypothetical protein